MKPKLLEHKVGYNGHNQILSRYSCPYCEKEFIKASYAVNNGNTSSCGCLIKMTFAERRIARALNRGIKND